MVFCYSGLNYDMWKQGNKLELQNGSKHLAHGDQGIICWPHVSLLRPISSPSKYSIQSCPVSRMSVTPRFPAYPITGEVMFPMVGDIFSYFVTPSLHEPPRKVLLPSPSLSGMRTGLPSRTESIAALRHFLESSYGSSCGWLILTLWLSSWEGIFLTTLLIKLPPQKKYLPWSCLFCYLPAHCLSTPPTLKVP